MVEKRFIVDDYDTLIDLETGDFFYYISNVKELLNNLSHENKQLKIEKQSCCNEVDKYKELNIQLDNHNKELIQENKELKEDIDDLRETLALMNGELEEMEYLND